MQRNSCVLSKESQHLMCSVSLKEQNSKTKPERGTKICIVGEGREQGGGDLYGRVDIIVSQ